MTLLFTALFSAILCSHPLHVSFTSIDIGVEKKEADLSFKFYTDDFSLLFYHLYEKNIQPVMDQEISGDQLMIINGYLKKAFSLVAEQDTIDFRYIRKEQNEESIWLYYKGVLPGNAECRFSLVNQLMLDLYEDQTNLVIVTKGTHEKGFAFNYRDRRYELDFGQD